jgi:hypothetical protein
LSDTLTLTPDRCLALLDRLLNEMIDQQEGKVLRMARRTVPDLTPEDLRNPHDFPQLSRDPIFNYEDGILAGLRSAHIAIRAELRRLQEDSGT